MTMSDQTRQQAPVPETRAGTPGRELIRDRMQWLGSRYALLAVWLLMAVIYGFVTPHNFLRISTAGRWLRISASRKRNSVLRPTMSLTWRTLNPRFLWVGSRREVTGPLVS